jgi:hypothetical protein
VKTPAARCHKLHAENEATLNAIRAAASALGKLGGRKTSEAKTASCRANAKRPRPRKKKKV